MFCIGYIPTSHFRHVFQLAATEKLPNSYRAGPFIAPAETRDMKHHIRY